MFLSLLNRLNSIFVNNRFISYNKIDAFHGSLMSLKSNIYNDISDIRNDLIYLLLDTLGFDSFMTTLLSLRFSNASNNEDDMQINLYNVEALYLVTFDELINSIKSTEIDYSNIDDLEQYNVFKNKLDFFQYQIRGIYNIEYDLHRVQNNLILKGQIPHIPTFENLSSRELYHPREQRRVATPGAITPDTSEQGRERGFLQGNSNRFPPLPDRLDMDMGREVPGKTSNPSLISNPPSAQVRVGDKGNEGQPAPQVTVSMQVRWQETRDAFVINPPAHSHVHIHPDPEGHESVPSLGDVDNILDHSDPEQYPQNMIIGTRNHWFLIKRFRQTPLTEDEIRLLREKSEYLQNLFPNRPMDCWNTFIDALKHSGIGVYRQVGTEDINNANEDVLLRQWDGEGAGYF